jgi:hypothetical protein
VTSRLDEYFNTSCFTVPGPFTYGNEARTDARVRQPGIDDFDFALGKTTHITESVGVEVRAEAYNLFNRVQFGPPGTTVTTTPNSTYGQITTQLNQPRIVQLGGRLRF